jgi:hypothetical protein
MSAIYAQNKQSPNGRKFTLILSNKQTLPASPVLVEWLNLEGIGDKKEKKVTNKNIAMFEFALTEIRTHGLLFPVHSR